MPVSPQPAQSSVFKLIGPGLLVAAAGIGAGDTVAATMAGAAHGLSLLWVVALAAFMKRFLNEGIARFQLATGMTAVEGWSRLLPWWVRVYFAIYLVIWTLSVTAALASACGLGIATLSGGAITRPWGAAAHAVIGGVLVFLGGYQRFEQLMKVLIGTMFFAIVACAVLTVQDPSAIVAAFVTPTIPPAGGPTVLSLIGGIGGSVSMLAYNYWMREEGMSGPAWLRFVRADITIAYCFTALFGMSVMILANQAFHSAGVAITNAQAVTKMADTLGSVVGPVGFYMYAVGFWAAVFASLLGVWQSVPYLFADYYGLMRGYSRETRQQLTTVSSTPYRIALLFVTLVPLPFAFADQPLIIIRAFTIVGSVFVPFLAATLLYLNNYGIPADSNVPRNSALNNAVLAFALLLFALVGASEAGLFRL
jgi:Mn2+/Fe2+ NRAMP family transporter